MSFAFRGELPGSKSLFIRALVAASFGSDLKVAGVVDSEDVVLAKAGLDSLRGGTEIDCGDAGAVLRFLALRASRVPGDHQLVGSARLFSRPISELQQVLQQLGVTSEVGDRSLLVHSQGWRATSVTVDCSRSSQFASAVLANSWGLDSPLAIELLDLSRSRGYWDMTADVVGELGMALDVSAERVVVPADQVVTADNYAVEVDMGCAFAVAAIAAVAGEAVIESFPTKSLQPDSRFPDLLAAMGAAVAHNDDGTLVVRQSEHLSGIDVELGGSPDLFPVMAALAATARGASKLDGAPHLRFKESDRIAKVAELISAMGRQVEILDDGVLISGEAGTSQPFAFDADQDHRMAMAAAVTRLAGHDVTLTGGDSVEKSFGGFWDIVGWQP